MQQLEKSETGWIGRYQVVISNYECYNKCDRLPFLRDTRYLVTEHHELLSNVVDKLYRESEKGMNDHIIAVAIIM